jgi:predicted DNA binding CopG/RHH family protein
MSEERSTWIQIRVTPSELAKVKADAEARGLGVSDYLRKLAKLKLAAKGRPKSKTK